MPPADDLWRAARAAHRAHPTSARPGGRVPVRAVGERPPVATAASRSALALRYLRARPVALATPMNEAIEQPRQEAPVRPTATGPTTIVTPAGLRPGTGAMGFRMQTFAQPRRGVGAGTTGTTFAPRASSGTFAFPKTSSHGGAVSSGVIHSRALR